MSEYVIMPKADYVSACNKIREKTQKTDLIKSGDLVQTFEEIIPTSEEKTVTPDFSGGDMEVTPSNGAMFSKVTVQKPENLLPENIAEGAEIAGIVGALGGNKGIDIVQVAEGTISEVDSENVTKIVNYAFYGNSALTRVNTPNLLSVGDYGFCNCTGLSEVNAPNLASVGTYGFFYCSGLKVLNTPNLKTLKAQAFYMASNLEQIDVSSVQNVGAYAFQGTKVKKLDFGTSINAIIGRQAFATDEATDVIIRNTTMIPTPTSKNDYLFTRTTQRLFVPKALVSTWKASNYMVSYHSNQVYAIEDYPDICG